MLLDAIGEKPWKNHGLMGDPSGVKMGQASISSAVTCCRPRKAALGSAQVWLGLAPFSTGNRNPEATGTPEST